jgi:glutathione S-transferase
MIKLLGRQTSGNVQKVIFCLEEMRVPYVAGRAWFALERFTIADVALGTIVKRCLEFPIERPPCPELTRWQATIEARPAFAVAVGAKESALTPAA